MLAAENARSRLVDVCIVFFVKQKTAYEMRISDWSSDVCSSDLARRRNWRWPMGAASTRRSRCRRPVRRRAIGSGGEDRKSVVSGKSVSVRVDLGGSRNIQKKTPRSNRLTNLTTTNALQHKS